MCATWDSYVAGDQNPKSQVTPWDYLWRGGGLRKKSVKGASKAEAPQKEKKKGGKKSPRTRPRGPASRRGSLSTVTAHGHSTRSQHRQQVSHTERPGESARIPEHQPRALTIPLSTCFWRCGNNKGTAPLTSRRNGPKIMSKLPAAGPAGGTVWTATAVIGDRCVGEYGLRERVLRTSVRAKACKF